MDAKKALIITWIVIGLVLAGLGGFYLGRSSFGTGTNKITDMQGPGQTPPSGISQPGQGGTQVVTPGVKK